MKKKSSYILAIGSSCDDTAAAVLKNNEVLSNCIANQEIHRDYGGVVPELASRAHQVNIVPVVEQALSIANIDKNQLNAIAYTRGPGLLGSLLVGSSFSKSLSIVKVCIPSFFATLEKDLPPLNNSSVFIIIF